jgi:hypothetical protein
MIDYEQPQPPQTGAALQQTGLQQRCLQHLTLQHFCLQQRSLQQRCLQHFCLQQLFSQPQEGAAAQVGSAAQVGAAAAQVGAGAAQVGAAAPQVGAAAPHDGAQHEGLQQRLWWQRHFLYFTQQVGWQEGWQLLSQPQPPRNSNAEALDAIQNNATATHKPAIRLFMENSSNQKHRETETETTGNYVSPEPPAPRCSRQLRLAVTLTFSD